MIFIFKIQNSIFVFLWLSDIITEYFDTIEVPRNRKFFYYDIALIKVTKEFKINDNVASIDLPCEKLKIERDDSLIISGMYV